MLCYFVFFFVFCLLVVLVMLYECKGLTAKTRLCNL